MWIRSATIAMITLLLTVGVPSEAGAADSDATARMREMLHRAQEALRQAQSENADLARAKSDVEQKLAAASKQLETAQNGSKAAQASLHSQLTAAAGTQADLTHKLAEATDRLAVVNAKLNDTANQLNSREAEIAQLDKSLEESKVANASCERKNAKLYSYALDLLQAYHNKGVWASLSQKEPVLGLKEVDVENLMQEYKLKLAAEKVNP